MMHSMKRDHKSTKLISQESDKTIQVKMNIFWFFVEIERNTIQEHIPKIQELVNGNFFLLLSVSKI